jgi:hypothetical protein
MVVLVGVIVGGRAVLLGAWVRVEVGAMVGVSVGLGFCVAVGGSDTKPKLKASALPSRIRGAVVKW